MSYENIKLERDGAVAVVTVNRPKVLNALNAATFDDIEAAFAEIADDDSVRAVVVTGEGDRAFVAGADINGINALKDSEEGQALGRRGQEVFDKVADLSKPVIAAVNGFALGGGCEFALACDIRIASDAAKLGLPEINLGVIPGYAGTQRLPRLIGASAAKMLIYTGDMVDAQEAMGLGLVNKVVPAAELMDTAKKLAAKMAAKSATAIALAKKAVDSGLEATLPRGQFIEAEAFGVACVSPDGREGTSAFLEKRKAEFNK